MLAIGEDLRYRCTEGAPATVRTRIMHRCMDAVGRLTTTDPGVRLRLLRAFHMIASSLFAPPLVWKVLTAHSAAAPPPLEPVG